MASRRLVPTSVREALGVIGRFVPRITLREQSVREQSGPGTTPPVPTWCTSGSNSAALPASPSSTKGASPAATPITFEWNGRYPRRHRRSEKTRSNTRVPADGSRDGFGGAETHRSWSVARSSGKTARYWQGNGLQTRRRNAPRSFFALNVILGTTLPMTPRRSLQRIRPHAGRRVEDARNHVQRGLHRRRRNQQNCVGRQQSVHLPNVGSRPLRPARHHRAHGERLGQTPPRPGRTVTAKSDTDVSFAMAACILRRSRRSGAWRRISPPTGLDPFGGLRPVVAVGRPERAVNPIIRFSLIRIR